ncbi:carotenoid biosynthesis protein [Deinococcus sp. KSM4-11]|uniref:carotenoid biosynthesis protein n=1 Tax=Deinococcus sp. KSM4-11 TaxID=2568654 RepID=UPI0010A45322|nr:carotenoid biosynthesis protein [Deinococcus sp. KSM4-11]THF86450.1 carotenoid biosynthesis protein [Deinococcus sp. KSM4-11]
MPALSPTLRRAGLALLALGVAFLGALLVIAAHALGWALIALGLPLAGALALAGDTLGHGFWGTLAQRGRALAAQTPTWLWFVALYAALKIPVPLWPQLFPLLGLLSTGALFVAALLFVWERENAAKAAIMALVAFGVGLGVEVAGSRTGIPFGDYSYAGAPAPTLLGVPLVVPLGWFALTLTATSLSGGRPWLAGVLMMLWDVGLEPLMTAQGYWTWHDLLGLWAGAPLENFVGWWGVGALLSWMFTGLSPRLFGLNSLEWAWALPWFARAFPMGGGPSLSLLPRPSVSRVGFGVVYSIEVFFLPGGLVLVGRYAEAAVTLVAMLAGLGLAWRVTRRDA